MHKTHIFDQKNNAKKKKFLLTYLTYFFRAVTENKQIFFLGLTPWDLFDKRPLDLKYLKEPFEFWFWVDTHRHWWKNHSYLVLECVLVPYIGKMTIFGSKNSDIRWFIFRLGNLPRHFSKAENINTANLRIFFPSVAH